MLKNLLAAIGIVVVSRVILRGLLALAEDRALERRLLGDDFDADADPLPI